MIFQSANTMKKREITKRLLRNQRRAMVHLGRGRGLARARLMMVFQSKVQSTVSVCT